MVLSPKVSVVITTRNRPEQLPDSLRSVLEQTIAVSEIIVVDDASSIPAETVLETLDEHQIRYLRHTKVRGGSAARNTGLDAACSPFVAFLDDDDTWAPEKLEKQLAILENATPEVGGVFSYSCKLSPLDPTWRQVERTPSLQLSYSDFLKKTYFGASVPLLRKEYLVAAGGFDENLLSVQDRDMWLRLALDYTFVGVPEVLVRNYIHGDQITTDLSKKIAGREQFLEKHKDGLMREPSILASHLWRLGLMYCLAGAYSEGQQRFRQALNTDPNCQGPADDLRQSAEAPEEHANSIAERHFKRVGDLILYY